MLTEFEKKIADFIIPLDCLRRDEKVLFAVSGGADSTALLYAMAALKNKGVLKTGLICAHINHQLRTPDADIDEKFVVTQAASLSLQVFTKKIDVRQFAQKNKLSIEAAARQLRIETLTDIARANNCNCIATAHQKNDNAETVVHRLLRGTGFRGLAGIQPLRNFSDDITFVRPLLCVTRDQIIDYLKDRKVQWRTDQTNYDCRYKRNFLRHKLIPYLQKDCTELLSDTLHELSVSAQRFLTLVENTIDNVWPQIANFNGNQIALDLQTFLNQPKPVQVELICRSLTSIGCGLGNLTHEHFERIFAISQQNVSNKKVILPSGFCARREYEDLIFNNAKCQKSFADTVTLQIPGKTNFGGHSIEATVLTAAENSIEVFKTIKTPFVEWFDFDKLHLPLVIRPRLTGDKFIPIGLASEKKIGKFLTDSKAPQQMRQKMFIVADSENIIWLCPLRISEQARVTDRTKTILQLQITGTD